MHSAKEIAAALRTAGDEVKNWGNSYSGNFDAVPEDGRWSAAEHIAHLSKSTKPLNKALRLPRFILKWRFGNMQGREERDFNGTRDHYLEKLAKRDLSNNPFAANNLGAGQKDKLVNELVSELNRLADVSEKWKENKLSSYILPHPVSGYLSIREMLFFTIYHTQHHLKTLQQDY